MALRSPARSGQIQSNIAGSHSVPVEQSVVAPAGQEAARPLQLLAAINPELSALQEADEQTKSFPRNTSVGQAAVLPVQLSATSQTPAAARHWVPAATSTSAGHEAAPPVHFSATSQSPADD